MDLRDIWRLIFRSLYKKSMDKLRSLIIFNLSLFITIGNFSCCCCLCPSRGKTKSVYYGMATYYGKEFHGKKTASGEMFNMFDLTAAHRTLPFGTKVRVTNLKNNKSVIVRINDRGPFVKGRIIDLSYAAAEKIDLIIMGETRVKVEVLD